MQCLLYATISLVLNIRKLNRRQLDKLSDIFSDLGLVAFASVVVPALFDKLDILRVILGLLAALIFWLVSLILRR